MITTDRALFRIQNNTANVQKEMRVIVGGCLWDERVVGVRLERKCSSSLVRTANSQPSVSQQKDLTCVWISLSGNEKKANARRLFGVLFLKRACNTIQETGYQNSRANVYFAIF